jgi:hypothetical protein
VHEIASVLSANVAAPRTPKVARLAHAHALVALGLGIELGRLIVAHGSAEQEVEDLLRLMRCALPAGG